MIGKSDAVAFWPRAGWNGQNPKFRGSHMAMSAKAFSDCAGDVRTGVFPDEDHGCKMKPEEIERFHALLAEGG